jgi:VanZ family protein
VRARLAPLVFGLLVGISFAMFLTPGEDVPQGGPDDKVVHALIFVALAIAGRWAQVPWLRLGLGLAAYAALTEILQTTLPIHRDGNVPDFLADSIGIAAGLVLALTATRLVARARPPRSRSQSPR